MKPVTGRNFWEKELVEKFFVAGLANHNIFVDFPVVNLQFDRPLDVRITEHVRVINPLDESLCNPELARKIKH